eukprot:GFYU01001545.1.p1 GENE.GFYU01001545.1~~GFYU01001545.1.p1  ORF type:complete len:690 (+),score=167.34 GFYU01001545.1:141-2210(+)
MSFLDKLLFPAPSPSRYTEDSFDGELCWIPRSLVDPDSEKTVPALFLPAKNGSKTILIYHHGNAEDLGLSRAMLKVFRRKLNVHILAFEYPGYGIFNGEANERSVDEAAEVAYLFVAQVLKWPAENIILLGRSIGGGPAIKVAASYPVGGLILISAFSSIREMAKYLVSNVAGFFVPNIYPNKANIQQVKCRTLIVHGKEDTLVPYTHGEVLFEQAGASAKNLFLAERMDHNCFDIESDIIHPIRQFFDFRGGGVFAYELPPEIFDKPDLWEDLPDTPPSASSNMSFGQVIGKVLGIDPTASKAPTFRPTANHLLQAALYGDVHTVTLALDHNVDVDTLVTEDFCQNVPSAPNTRAHLTTFLEGTSLHLAAFHGHVGVVKILLAKRSSPNVKDKMGRVPLHYAARHMHCNLVELLLDYGAETNVRDMGGQTPLHHSSKCAETTQVLIKRGADASIRDGMGETALHSAVSHRSADVVEVLVQACGNNTDIVRQSNHAGLTPLGLAMSSPQLYDSDEAVVRIIVSIVAKGGDTSENLTVDGMLPLGKAITIGNEEIIRSLLNHGAVPSAKDKHNRNAMDYALECFGSDTEITNLVRRADERQRRASEHDLDGGEFEGNNYPTDELMEVCDQWSFDKQIQTVDGMRLRRLIREKSKPLAMYYGEYVKGNMTEDILLGQVTRLLANSATPKKK